MGSMAFGATMGRTGAGNLGMTQPAVPPLCIDPLVTAMLQRAGTNVPPSQPRSTSAAFAVRILLCCAVLCCAVLCCAVLCCAVLCCAVLCHKCCARIAVLCCVVLCYVVPCRSQAVPRHAMPCCAVLWQLEQNRAATSVWWGNIPIFLCLAMS